MSQDLAEHPLRDRDHHSRSGRLSGFASPIALALAGTALLAAGYWGASDTVSPGDQIPYLASGTIPGATMVITAAVLLLRIESRRARDEAAGVAARLDALVEWLVGASDAPEEPEEDRTTGTDAPLRS